MLRSILFVMLSLLAGNCFGQSLDAFKNRLQQTDSTGCARVQVVEHGSAASAVARLRASANEEKIKGFRVRIFSDNSQNARTRAEETLRRFTEVYPGIPTYISYRNPYWEVSVGNCTGNEEAVILKGRIEGSFSNATISREEIPIAKLAE